ncbi:MAG: ATP-NAD kinase family protein [Hyphomicrobiaceae bacterium]|nr:ATP-NAD kinase family protein [Hyphomicrobiaceae bacterium]
MTRIGFILNPIAGMGGRVGLKGTDDVLEEAVRRGAEPVSAGRARDMLMALRAAPGARERLAAVRWLTCAGSMGGDVLSQAGFETVEIVYVPKPASDAGDTAAAVQAMLAAGAELILFCGGDGTARDIAAAAGRRVPVLGIPSGVKMYSGVFGTTPARTADILVGFLEGRLEAVEAEVLDLDEERYRAGEWAVRRHQVALTPYEPNYTQAAKQIVSEVSDAQAKQDIADYLGELIAAAPGRLVLLGPGTTVQAVAAALGIAKSLLGIDAVVGGTCVGSDLDERGVLDLLARHADVLLVLSPIGAQGFVLGRGNLQLSPRAIRRVGLARIVVVATPAKLARTPDLRFDTGDAALDAEIAAHGHLAVVVGYRRHRMVRIRS